MNNCIASENDSYTAGRHRKKNSDHFNISKAKENSNKFFLEFFLVSFPFCGLSQMINFRTRMNQN